MCGFPVDFFTRFTISKKVLVAQPSSKISEQSSSILLLGLSNFVNPPFLFPVTQLQVSISFERQAMIDEAKLVCT